ncbi:TorD/DmsD family molecular chaperone [Limisalsivibrio acetivorans]|uniref:TorD/DmsD family molecular chaperone n=1 Tax=Limisalsivibrio acetivorans TaxID=1304888 RepID=UPI0003B35E4F|nr:molecular chaperone TorD family protein [Limisalsivibrio acetivorans]
MTGSKKQTEMYTDMIRMSVAFSFMYKLFSELPEEEFIEELAGSAELFDEWPLMESEESNEGVALIKSSIENKESYEAIRHNFNKLFIGPGHLYAAPWESVYLERDGTMFGKATLDVRGYYKKYGLKIHNLHKEPDDHVAYECAFVNFLCMQYTEAVDKGEDPSEYVEVLKSFLDEHLLVWSGNFVEQVTTNSTTDFYKGAGKLLEGALKESREILG